MTAIPPIRYVWAGEALEPASPLFQKLADAHLCIGETYIMVEHQERSHKSHAHYFAAVNDAWRTLPDRLLEEYPSSEHLRKKALIRKGYCDERSIVCASKAAAQHFAAFIKPMDHYAIVVARESVVTVYTAKSQSMRAMGKKEFAESKQAVLDFIDDLLGVERGQTKTQAGQAA